MDLHMREFDGTTFGMSVEASSPAFRRMKKNAFTGKIKPRVSAPFQNVVFRRNGMSFFIGRHTGVIQPYTPHHLPD